MKIFFAIALSAVLLVAQEGKIVPFSGVDNIIPGITQYKEVTKEFGKSASTKVIHHENTVVKKDEEGKVSGDNDNSFPAPLYHPKHSLL
jgi:hypothetical protein